MKLLLSLIIMMLANATYAEVCSLDPRESAIKKMNQVTLSTDHWTRIELPVTAIKGIEPVIYDGLVVDKESTIRGFNNHLVIKASNENYRSKIVVFGYAQKIVLDVSTDKCGDTMVTLHKADPKKKQIQAKNQGSVYPDKQYRYLATYVAFEGKAPAGYRYFPVNLPEKERLVMRQGSVSFYIKHQWIGPKYICSVFEAVNNGRTTEVIQPQLIDYSKKEIKEAFGEVHHVGVLPINRELAPKPRRASINHTNMFSNRGLLYVVSERKNG